MKLFMTIPLIIILTATSMQTTHRSKQKKSEKKKSHAPLSYHKDVFPIITTYCLPCHTEDQMNPSQLYLDTYQNMTAGGKHGKPIVPGRADSSLIVQKLSLHPPFGDPMPMKRKTPFSDDTLRIIKTWIDQGAKDN